MKLKTGADTQLEVVDLTEEIPMSQNRNQQMLSQQSQHTLSNWDPKSVVSKAYAPLLAKMRAPITQPSSIYPQLLTNGELLAGLIGNESDMES